MPVSCDPGYTYSFDMQRCVLEEGSASGDGPDDVPRKLQSDNGIGGNESPRRFMMHVDSAVCPVGVAARRQFNRKPAYCACGSASPDCVKAGAKFWSTACSAGLDCSMSSCAEVGSYFNDDGVVTDPQGVALCWGELQKRCADEQPVLEEPAMCRVCTDELFAGAAHAASASCAVAMKDYVRCTTPGGGGGGWPVRYLTVVGLLNVCVFQSVAYCTTDSSLSLCKLGCQTSPFQPGCLDMYRFACQGGEVDFKDDQVRGVVVLFFVFAGFVHGLWCSRPPSGTT